MTKAVSLLHQATEVLSRAGIDSAHVDAALLLASVMKVERSQLSPFMEVPLVEEATFHELIAQRAKRIPLQHLTGVAYFRYLTLSVGQGVFVPRPETELLAQVGIEYLCTRQAPRIAVDLCSGSGAIALALATEVPNTTVYAVEKSAEAFEWLKQNVAQHTDQLARVHSQVHCHLGDATDVTMLAHLAGSVDAVLSNPPYIPDAMIPRDAEVRDFDPSQALFGGPDGLDVVRGVDQVARALLKPGGFIGIEHADVQGQRLPELLAQSGVWTEIADHLDYNQLPRFTTAHLTTVQPDAQRDLENGASVVDQARTAE